MANSHIIPALLLRTTFSPKIFNASHYWQCFALLTMLRIIRGKTQSTREK